MTWNPEKKLVTPKRWTSADFFEEEAHALEQSRVGFTRIVVSAAAAAAAASGLNPALAETSDAQSEQNVEAGPQGRLIEQARYWNKKGRPDLAEQSLQRLLTSEPKNVHAIYEMARVMLAKGETQSAQTYAARLQKLVGDAGLYEQLRREIDIATIDNKALKQARGLVAKGDFKTALQVYDRTLGGRQLVGDIAIEYYETMAGLEERWDEARAGLQQVIDTSPDSGRAQVALARIETYHPETRRTAIKRLLTLAETGTEREAALDAARQALSWLDLTDDDETLVSTYASFRPADKDVIDLFDNISNPSEETQHAASITRAFAFLESNNVDDAMDAFEDLVALDKNDAEALAGLGIVHVRQENYSEAVDLLRRAVRMDDKNREDFRRALQSAEFGADIQSVRRAIDAGDYESANALSAELKPGSASDRAQIASVRAEIASARGDVMLAERSYREALDLNPQDEYAYAGLLDVLVADEAADRLQTALGRYTTRMESPRAQASLAKARGWLAARRDDSATAIEQYQIAVVNAPSDPWIRLDAARALRSAGRNGDANRMFDGVERSRKPDMAHAAALFAFEGREWSRVQSLMGMVPAEALTPDMQRLVSHAKIQIGVDRALLAASTGDVSTARRGLLELYAPGRATPDESLLIGSALLELGDKQTAASLIRQGLQARSDATVAELADGAKLLIAADAFDAAEAVLEGLEPKVWQMNEAERLTLASVHDDLMVSRAREALRNGNVSLALDFVAPVHEANPVHGGALRALGEINIRSGRREAGLKFYESAIDVDPEDMDAIRGAVGALTDMREYKAALTLLDDAMVRGLDKTELYQMKSEVYRSSGDLKRALEALEDAQNSGHSRPSALGLFSQNDNPFRSLPSQSAYARNSEPGRPTASSYLPKPSVAAPSAPAAPLPSERRVDHSKPESQALLRPISFTASPAPSWASRKSAEPTETVMALRIKKEPTGSQEDTAPASEATTLAAPDAAIKADRADAVEKIAFTPGASGPYRTAAPVQVAPAEVDLAPTLPEAQHLLQPAVNRDVVVSDVTQLTPVQSTTPPGASVRDRLEAIGSPGLQSDKSGSSKYSATDKEDLAWEIAELENKVSPSLSEEFGFRWREGDEGTSSLTEFSLPVAYGVTLGDGRLTTTAKPVFLSSGEIGDDPIRRRNVGAMASVDPDRRLDAPDDAAGGVALNLAYDIGGVHVDLGTTPLGFQVPNLTGGLSYETRLESGLGLDVGIARRAVTDSLLSYAGLTDSITGEDYGAVTDTRLRLGLSLALDGASLYVNGAGIVREGENVDSNSGVQLDTGMSLFLTDNFSTGFNVTYLGYETNQRHFTLGHGGYFSPQSFVSATLPLNYKFESSRFKVDFRNNVGIQYYDEDGASLFPNRSDLTADAITVAAAEALTAPPGTELPLGYEAETKTSLAARSAITTEYKINRSLALQSHLSVDRAADWTEVVGLVGLKYTLNASRR